MGTWKKTRSVGLTLLLLVTITGAIVSAEKGADATASRPDTRPLRRTALVELIEKVSPAVVDITVLKPGKDEPTVIAGTGSVLHPSGYILSNDHVVADALQNYVTTTEGRRYPYRLVARLPYEDLAIVKIDPATPLNPVGVGRSDDLMLGEEVLAIGNSQGLGHSVAPGIVSGLDRPLRASPRSRAIQTDAAINRGNSGGPLLNALGEMIGIIFQKNLDAENISFAIEVDRFREILPELMSAEQQFGVIVGMDVDTIREGAEVIRVAAGSPAEEAGVAVGDLVLKAGTLDVATGLDYYLAVSALKAGEAWSVRLKRGKEEVSTKLTIPAFEGRLPVDGSNVREGVHVAAYLGRWDELPDFAKLTPHTEGITNRISHDCFRRDGNKDENLDHFALKFAGLIKVPEDGLYFFYTESDDGSRLYVGDELVVDNDTHHPILETGGMVRLKAGFHPITVTFFERDGEEFLKVSYEGPGVRRQEIPPDVIFCTTGDESDRERPGSGEPKKEDRPEHAEDKNGSNNLKDGDNSPS